MHELALEQFPHLFDVVDAGREQPRTAQEVLVEQLRLTAERVKGEGAAVGVAEDPGGAGAHVVARANEGIRFLLQEAQEVVRAADGLLRRQLPGLQGGRQVGVGVVPGAGVGLVFRVVDAHQQQRREAGFDEVHELQLADGRRHGQRPGAVQHVDDVERRQFGGTAR